MRVLVACEFSGRVRDAFIARGHDALSCDLEPSDTAGPHFQGDVLELLTQPWDMLIAFPPCTYLSYAGTAHWNKPGRAESREAAMEFFLRLYYAPISRVCVENPLGYPCQKLGPPTQIIQPFGFGHSERKRTCLWLRNLPKLKATELVAHPKPDFRDKTTGKARYYTDRQAPGPQRQKIRSTTFQGVADAMADQWGAGATNRVG